MQPNEQFGHLADQASIDRTVAALKQNGIEAIVVENGAEARAMVESMIPAGAEIMNMTSQTAEAIGLAKEIVDSGAFDSIRKKFMSMDPKTQGAEMRRLGAAHEWVVGSVHAVTEDGHVLVASATGSQLGSYAYGAAHVLWIVGSQKIVKNFDEGMKRVYEYSLPLEDARAQKAYGRGSGVNKMLIVNKEVQPGRITMIIVKEKLGF